MRMNDAAPPRIVATEPVFNGWNKFSIATVEATDPSGTVRRHRREIIDHGEASVVLVLDRARDVAVMVRQWRAPLIAAGADPYLLEACAGIVDPGETPEQSAIREAEEEIGFKIRHIRKVGRIVPSAGTLTERMHLFVAETSEADRIAEGGGAPQEGEDIEVIEVPLSELFEMARRGEIEDAKTLVLVQHLMITELNSSR